MLASYITESHPLTSYNYATVHFRFKKTQPPVSVGRVHKKL